MSRARLEGDLAELHPASFGWALGCCRWDREEAEEVLQTTYLKILDGRARFDERSSFKTWLYQIAINLAKNVYRDRARFTQVPIDEVIIKRYPRTLDVLIQNESRLLLRKTVERLPEKQRLTLLFRIQEGRKFDEIAEIMKCSIGTAKANYHHAVQKLKAMMGQESGAGSLKQEKKP